MNTDKLYKDLGFNIDEVEPVPENVIHMPLRFYINMSEQHAAKVHLTNLLETYGEDLVADTLVSLLKAKV